MKRPSDILCNRSSVKHKSLSDKLIITANCAHHPIDNLSFDIIWRSVILKRIIIYYN